MRILWSPQSLRDLDAIREYIAKDSMIPSYRHSFNAAFTQDKYDRMRGELTARCGMEVPFALCETPCFFPAALVDRMGEDGKALIRQLVDNPD
ncbi:MAG: hypothetical protein WA172_05830, partial [Terriglobales bacterium]